MGETETIGQRHVEADQGGNPLEKLKDPDNVVKPAVFQGVVLLC